MRHSNDGGHYLALLAQNNKNIAEQRERATNSLFSGFASFGDALGKIDERNRLKENEEFQKQRALEQERLQKEAKALQKEAFDFQKEQEANRLKMQEWQNNFALKQWNERNVLNPLQKEQYRSLKLDNDMLERGYKEYMGLQSSISPISSYISQQENVSDTTEANTTIQREPLTRNEHIAQSTQRDTQNAMEKMWSNTPKIKNKNLKTNSGYEGEAKEKISTSLYKHIDEENIPMQFYRNTGDYILDSQPILSPQLQMYAKKIGHDLSKSNAEIKVTKAQIKDTIKEYNKGLLILQIQDDILKAINEHSGKIDGLKRKLNRKTGEWFNLTDEEQKFVNKINDHNALWADYRYGKALSEKKELTIDDIFGLRYGNARTNVRKIADARQLALNGLKASIDSMHELGISNKFALTKKAELASFYKGQDYLNNINGGEFNYEDYIDSMK